MNTEDITLETITETINSIKKMCNGQIIPDEIQNVIDMLQDFHNIYTNITKDLLKIINMTEKNNWVADADIVTKTFIDYDKYDKLYKDFYVKYDQQTVDSIISIKIKDKFNSFLEKLKIQKYLNLESCFLNTLLNKIKDKNTGNCDDYKKHIDQ
jgi:S-adenosylmethionine hydrolase